MKIGQYIKFDLDTWENDIHVLREYKAEIKNFIQDPFKRHESKCLVEINGSRFGIPFSEVKSLSPAIGEQLILKL